MSDENRQSRDVVVDPRVFIGKPYRECPSCKAKAAFGVLNIGPYQYSRRCKECWHTDSSPLPELKKKVLYLDQFAISNMMKALNPKGDREVEQFWLALFRRVDRLCKLQLLICPDSELHRQESMVSGFGPALKRMYEQLSGGLALRHPQEIEREQIYEHVQRWVEGRDSEPWEFDITDVINGDPNVWQGRLMVLTQGGNADGWIEELNRSRQAVDREMAAIFERWQQEDFDFWDCFREEARSYSIMLDLYKRGHMRGVLTVAAIHNALRNVGVAESDWSVKTKEYLTSDAIERLPCQRISALLTAAVARKVATGQKRVPTSGTLNDFRFISTFLPYCDAMLIDNECYALATDMPLREEIAPYACRLFCKNTKDDLMSFLDDIEAKASPEHLATVREVYGTEWEKPYETMYSSSET